MKQIHLSFYLFFLALFTIVSLSACAQKKKPLRANNNRTISKPVGPNISYVQMRRTSCFGTCPVYTIEIYNDGLVRYSGKKFVEKLGIYEKNIGVQSAHSLLKLYEQARPDTMMEKYEVGVSDVPDLFFVFTLNGDKKEIQNAMFGPQILKEIALETDHLIGQPDFSWKRTATTVEQ